MKLKLDENLGGRRPARHSRQRRNHLFTTDSRN
jgi:hypothetical protein